MLECDVELGGTDQLFNLMVGRDLMRSYGKRPQIVMTTPLLEGIDARVEDGRIVGKKMSKSADNVIGLTEPPLEMFRKCMQIGDDVVWRFYELLSARSSAEIEELRLRNDPLALKAEFGRELVTRFHSAQAADEAMSAFRRQYLGDGVPDEIPEVQVPMEGQQLLLAKGLSAARLVPSTSEAKRLISQGGVEVDGTRVADEKHLLDAGKRYLVRVGSKKRRFCYISPVSSKP